MFAILMSALLMTAAEPAPSAAAPDSPALAVASPTAKPAPKRKNGAELVCWEEKPGGTHMTKRICATRDELERAEQDAKDSMNHRLVPTKQVIGSN